MPAEEVAKRRAEFDKVKQTALEQRKKAGVAMSLPLGARHSSVARLCLRTRKIAPLEWRAPKR
jgi:hypothetical protein